MNEDLEVPSGEYESWKRSLAKRDAPAGFAERVMAAVSAEPAPRRSFLSALLASPYGRAAAILLAVALFLGRLACVVWVLVPR